MRVRDFVWLTVVCVAEAQAIHAQTPSLKTVMQVKVENTERLLRPIVTADFSMIDRYAERLSRISYTEISSWQTRPESGYADRATAFLNAVQRLRRAAVERNPDEAAAGYTMLVTSCYQCHRYVQRTTSIAFQEHTP